MQVARLPILHLKSLALRALLLHEHQPTARMPLVVFTSPLPHLLRIRFSVLGLQDRPIHLLGRLRQRTMVRTAVAARWRPQSQLCRVAS